MRELSLNVLDIAQNSITAGATLIRILIQEDTESNRMEITVEDNGCGMTSQQIQQVCDPFFTSRTSRKVGLGVPLFQMAAEMTGGTLNIQSEPGKGTRVCATFCTDHMDMTSLGNINQTVVLLIQCNPTLDFVFRHSRNHRQLILETTQLRSELGETILLNDPDVLQWITAFLQKETQRLVAGEIT